MEGQTNRMYFVVAAAGQPKNSNAVLVIGGHKFTPEVVFKTCGCRPVMRRTVG